MSDSIVLNNPPPPTPSRLPGPPKTMPVNTPLVEPAETCKDCKRPKKCEKAQETRGVMNYGCWCGPNNAPAVNKKIMNAKTNKEESLELSAPKNEAEWDKWIIDNELPQAKDGVDKCCLVHDLELGVARQDNPNASFSSADKRIARINARLSACFAREGNNKKNGAYGRAYALTAAPLFSDLSGYNSLGASLKGATAAVGDSFNKFAIGGVTSSTTGGYHSAQ